MTARIGTITNEQLWEIEHTLREYTETHILGMSRAEFEAHKVAIEALGQVSINKFMKGMDEDSAPPQGTVATWDGQQEEAQRIREERCSTALDEYETARLWATSKPRYMVTVSVDGIRGYQNVEVHLYHRPDSMPIEEMAGLVVLAPDRTIQDVTEWYTATAIEQTFSKAEVQQLYIYLKRQSYFRGMKAHRTWPPDNNCLGYGAYPVGGGEGWCDFYKDKDYSLPFKVEGYYDIRPQWQAKIDKETVDIAEAIAKGKNDGCTGDMKG